jgi:hypothetical protein
MWMWEGKGRWQTMGRGECNELSWLQSVVAFLTLLASGPSAGSRGELLPVKEGAMTSDDPVSLSTETSVT